MLAAAPTFIGQYFAYWKAFANHSLPNSQTGNEKQLETKVSQAKPYILYYELNKATQRPLYLICLLLVLESCLVPR